MKTIFITSYKGGVGKTLTLFNFAGYLRNSGYKVLAVDLDGQMNLTRNMLPPGKKTTITHPYSVEDIYRRELTDEALHPDVLIMKNPLEKYENFDMIPSSPTLKGGEEYYSNQNPISINVSLSDWIKSYKTLLNEMYDFIIVDSNPKYDIGQFTAMTAADEIFLITDVSGNSLDGADRLFNKWSSQCKKTSYMENRISLTFANNVDLRTAIANAFIADIEARRKESPDLYCENFIKQCSKIKESEILGPVAFEKTADYTKNPGVISMIETFDELCKRRGLCES